MKTKRGRIGAELAFYREGPAQATQAQEERAQKNSQRRARRADA